MSLRHKDFFFFSSSEAFLFPGLGAGTTTTHSAITYYWASPVCKDPYGCDCVLKSDSDDTPVTVKPSISSISPSRGLIAATTSVTITGSGFGTSPSVQAGSGISVTVNSASNTQISASFAIASSAPAGNHNVTVTANGQTSNAVNFFVQVPTSLVVLSVSTLATGSTGNNVCIAGRDFGIVVSVNYEVLDQASALIASSEMRPQEKVLSLVINGESQGDPVPNWQDIGPSGVPGTAQFTDSQGRFLDAPVGSCGSFPIEVTFSQPISVLVGSTARYTLRTNSFSITSSSEGHGSITNGLDIQKTR